MTAQSGFISIKTEEGEVINGAVCNGHLSVYVKNPESTSSFAMSLEEMIEFAAQLQKCIAVAREG